MAETGGSEVRRIVVALDASLDSLAALEASAELAAALGAELAGLFIEDATLFRLAEHPAVFEIDFLSGRQRRLLRRQLERQLRVQAERARTLLARAAERRGVAWSFRSLRGSVAEELEQDASQGDLIVLGAVGRSLRRAPGSTVRALLVRGTGPVMVLRRGVRLGPVVHVVHDGSDAGWRALELAASLIRGRAARLSVFLLGSQRDRTRLREALDWWADRRGIQVRLIQLTEEQARLSRIVGLVTRERCGLMVLPRASLRGEQEALGEVLARLDCPVAAVG